MSHTIHLVYPSGPRPQPPHRIGTELASALSTTNPVRLHDWDSMERIRPESGDILVAHLHNWPRTSAKRSWRDPRWSRRVVLQPFNSDLLQNAFLDPYVMTADAFLAISAPAWVEALPMGPFRHWSSRTTQLDLAIDSTQYPFLDGSAVDPGTFLYVGHTDFSKRPDYLEEVALSLPEYRFGHIGGGRKLRGFTNYGYVDTASAEGVAIASQYRFLLMLSRADANPTAVLEAMAWGLVPVVSPACGYRPAEGVHLIDDTAVPRTVNALLEVTSTGAPALEAWRRANRRKVESEYTWDRFAAKAASVILSADQPYDPPPGTRLRRDRIILGAAALASPNISSARAIRDGIRIVSRSIIKRSDEAGRSGGLGD